MYINKYLKDLPTYSPPLSGRHKFEGLLLDFNERTQPLARNVYNSLVEFLNSGKANLYPEYEEMYELLSNYTKANKNNLLFTNGSNQGIDLIFRAITKIGDKTIIPTPSFPMFYQYANLMENKIVKIYYDKDTLDFPFEELLNSINNSIKLIVICNPNNPTGTSISKKKIIEILDKAIKCSAFVLVDEAYFEFSQETVADLVDTYSNLAVLRTFSKAFGMPSLRLGYIISNDENINNIKKIPSPYDVNMLALVAAKAALKDIAYVKKYAKEVMNQAKPFFEKFLVSKKIKFFKSNGNFVLVKLLNSDTIFQKLLDQNIRVRKQDKPLIEQTLRITIGTLEQMKHCINVFNNIL